MSEIDKMAEEFAADRVPFGDYGHGDVVAAIRAALLAAPPGWVLMPIEPADEQLMWLGGHDEASQRRAYTGLIASAPEPK